MISQHQQGWSLVEALVALLILVVGILGLVALQSSALKGNYQAYQRSQAAILSQDLAERIRVWRTLANDYAYSDSDGMLQCSNWTDSIKSAREDRDEWLNLVACRLPQARARIELQDSSLQVTVYWNCSTQTGCASYRYSTVF